MKYIIQDRETGNVIDEFSTMTEAEKTLEDYENQDKEDGIYKPEFYEIVEKITANYYQDKYDLIKYIIQVMNSQK